MNTPSRVSTTGANDILEKPPIDASQEQQEVMDTDPDHADEVVTEDVAATIGDELYRRLMGAMTINATGGEVVQQSGITMTRNQAAIEHAIVDEYYAHLSIATANSTCNVKCTAPSGMRPLPVNKKYPVPHGKRRYNMAVEWEYPNFPNIVKSDQYQIPFIGIDNCVLDFKSRPATAATGKTYASG